MNNSVIEAIEKGIATKSRFFAYRMPDGSAPVFGAQISESAISSSNFVIHPFIQDNKYPECNIAAEVSANEFLNIEIPKNLTIDQYDSVETSKEEYLSQVNNIITEIANNKLEKAVLSYTINKHINKTPAQWADIFNRLCHKYPSAFIFIYHTRESGFWLGASPEKFLSLEDGNLSTMALAGTRQIAPESKWHSKEIEEQAIVARYIKDQFIDANIEVTVSDTYTLNAGVVEHICNDFSANITDLSKIDHLISSLHPTPALAGFPKDEAIKIITSIEKHSRQYYGGYIGIKNNNNNFKYYVNLRSLQFNLSKLTLYVGGGITSDSIPENEWSEIMHKSKTLLSIISVS